MLLMFVISISVYVGLCLVSSRLVSMVLDWSGNRVVVIIDMVNRLL